MRITAWRQQMINRGLICSRKGQALDSLPASELSLHTYCDAIEGFSGWKMLFCGKYVFGLRYGVFLVMRAALFDIAGQLSRDWKLWVVRWLIGCGHVEW